LDLILGLKGSKVGIRKKVSPVKGRGPQLGYGKGNFLTQKGGLNGNNNQGLFPPGSF